MVVWVEVWVVEKVLEIVVVSCEDAERCDEYVEWVSPLVYIVRGVLLVGGSSGAVSRAMGLLLSLLRSEVRG